MSAFPLEIARTHALHALAHLVGCIADFSWHNGFGIRPRHRLEHRHR